MSAAAEPWDMRQAKIEAVLRRYATSEPSSTAAIPYSFLIPSISEQLVWEARGAPPTISREMANRKFIRMRDATKAFADLLDDPSLAVMIPLEDRLAIVRVAHLKVEASAGARPRRRHLAPRLLSGRSGQPKKEAAARVARVLAEHFEGLTGSPPTRITPIVDGYAQPSNGRFIAMLAEVYNALGIKASADNYATSAIRGYGENLLKNGGNTPH
jgi:hypothetical protein